MHVEICDVSCVLVKSVKTPKQIKYKKKIKPSASPWASPVVLMKKKDGGTRFCVDYQKLNELTKKDSYPSPWVDMTFDALSGSSWFSTLNLKSGYGQVEVEEQDREKTTFTAGNRLWQFNVMAFSLCNAPATFERLMDNILDDLRCLVELISKKCELFQCRVKFLGHVVSVEGVATDPEKVVVVTN